MDNRETKNVYIIDTKLIGYFLHQRGSNMMQFYDKIAEFLFNLPKGEIHLCWDIGKSSYRLAISPTYKGHRKDEYDKKTPEEKKALEDFNKDYIAARRLSDYLPVHNWSAYGVEADDFASIIAKGYENTDVNVYLLTGDYDWYHMVVGTSNVQLIDVNNGGMLVNHDAVVANYKLDTRRKFSVLKAILGDRSDNIKFCENLGPVKAQQVFDRVYDKYDEPTDEEVIQEINQYLAEKEEHRVKKKLKTSIKVHQHHVDVGRETPEAAYMANIKLADPFTSTEFFSEEQLKEFEKCKNREVPDGISFADFLKTSYEIVGYPINVGYKASRVFNIK